ncbi:F-box protein [Tripterygium wilfordii]|uniref:F-box protein n=1 Tax=Tripterygium wilfordii TaxID=458696 RepID=A0A7J7CN23_TRIWF|nr:F-box protein [Tripterygium wilfordii]
MVPSLFTGGTTILFDVFGVAGRENGFARDKSRNLASSNPFSSIVRLLFSGILKPLQMFGQFLGPKRAFIFVSGDGSEDDGDMDQSVVTHHSPTQVLKNFNEIRFLCIELPSGELGIDYGVLLKWRADFGSTLDNCVNLGAAFVVNNGPAKNNNSIDNVSDGLCVNSNGVNGALADDNESIPKSFYTNGGLKLWVVWTISSMIVASARHYLLQTIIAEHKTLDSLVLTDIDGQGVLCMNREQLKELRLIYMMVIGFRIYLLEWEIAGSGSKLIPCASSFCDSFLLTPSASSFFYAEPFLSLLSKSLALIL